MDIQEEIKSWKEKLVVIGQNLAELNDAEFVADIRKKVLSKNPYKGRTYTFVQNSMNSMNTLWADFLCMQKVIHDAVNMLKRNSIFHDNSADIHHLFESKCILLKTEVIPIEKRDLTVRAELEHRVCLVQAEKTMISQFQMARDNLFTLKDIQDEILRRVSIIKKNYLSDICIELNDIEDDPLDSMKKLISIEQKINIQKELLQTTEKFRQTILATLSTACNNMVILKSLVDKNRQLIIKLNKNFLNPIILNPITQDEILSLNAWTKSLHEMMVQSEPKLNIINIGVTKCANVIRETLQKEELSYNSNNKYIEEVSELKGRLSAFSAKAKALENRGVHFDSSLDMIKQQARSILDAKPINLNEARNLVQDFESTINNTKV